MRRLIYIATLVAIVGVAAYLSVGKPQLPGTVWLPVGMERTGDQWEALRLPTKSDVVHTPYGKALRYTTHESWRTIYQFGASAQLDPSDCPNIMNMEELLPSGCDKLGAFRGSPVYSIARALPSGATEYFVRLGDTFVFVHAGGDGGRSLGYLRNFKSMGRNEAVAYLKTNTARVAELTAIQRDQKAAAAKKSAAAYTKLDFAPALPSVLPKGWHRVKTPIQVDGQTADRPSMVRTEYTNDKERFVSFYVLKLSEGRFGDTCGPTPTQGMEDKPCYVVPGTAMREAIITSEYKDTFRYVYHVVGDSLVISFIAEYANNGTPPSWPAELVAIQDAMTANAKPVAKEALKGSVYERLFYY